MLDCFRELPIHLQPLYSMGSCKRGESCFIHLPNYCIESKNFGVLSCPVYAYRFTESLLIKNQMLVQVHHR